MQHNRRITTGRLQNGEGLGRPAPPSAKRRDLSRAAGLQLL